MASSYSAFSGAYGSSMRTPLSNARPPRIAKRSPGVATTRLVNGLLDGIGGTKMTMSPRRGGAFR